MFIYEVAERVLDILHERYVAGGDIEMPVEELVEKLKLDFLKVSYALSLLEKEEYIYQKQHTDWESQLPAVEVSIAPRGVLHKEAGRDQLFS